MVQTYLNHRIDQDLSCQVLKSALEQSTLERRDGVRNDDDQTGVQFHLAGEPNKIDTVVRDERELVFGDPPGQLQSGLPLNRR